VVDTLHLANRRATGGSVGWDNPGRQLVLGGWFQNPGEHAVIYKGVEYTVIATAEPDVWEWQFRLGDNLKTGRTQTRLADLAARRVRSKIDAALRAANSTPSTRHE
jgi:hypothetical protein